MSAIKFRKPNAQERTTFCGAEVIKAESFVSTPGNDISINELVIGRVTTNSNVTELFVGVVTALHDDGTYDLLPLQSTAELRSGSAIPSGWTNSYIVHRSLARNTINGSSLSQWLDAYRDSRVSPDSPCVNTGTYVVNMPREFVYKVKLNDFATSSLLRSMNTMRELRYNTKPGVRIFQKLARLAPGNLIMSRNRDIAASGMTYENIQYGIKQRQQQAEKVSDLLIALRKGGVPTWTRSGKTLLDHMQAGKKSGDAYREVYRGDNSCADAISVIQRISDKYVDLTNVGCGHIVKDQDTMYVKLSNSEDLRICKHCADKAFTETVYHNESPRRVEPDYIRANSIRTFDHGDDLVHITPPQALVRNYHSSKSKFTALPLLDGTHHFGVQVGIELEVQCTPKFASQHGTEERDEDDDDDDNEYTSGDSRGDDNAQNAAARMLHNAFGSAMKDVCGKANRYAFYEYDGSVDQGFEVISNYGPMETHRHIIATAMGPNAEGKYPYAKVLRSHDASSSCGLHVHLTKPKSLMHASRIYAFINSAQNKDLVECVARRYNNQYAAIKNETTKAQIGKAGKIAKNCKNYDGNVQPETIKTRFNQLHDESRYSAINYNNTHTVEFRMFKGSMLPTTVLACMEFAYMVWMFARDTSVEKLNEVEFIKYIKRAENLKESGYLRAYLIARGRMPAPNVKPGVRKPATPVAVTGET
ncbi:amidoligase family protein [Undibacterium sp. Ji42W]|uniref:amidoligase family protein n=1 Tax=Undibacterium sp. Ji42W TaxID=3413039 RepID=UPI003BF2D1F7